MFSGQREARLAPRFLAPPDHQVRAARSSTVPADSLSMGVVISWSRISLEPPRPTLPFCQSRDGLCDGYGHWHVGIGCRRAQSSDGCRPVDSGGDYVVADRFNNRIQLCPASSPQSACSTVAGTGTAASTTTQLKGPCGVAIDSSGNYAVADMSNHRVQLCPACQPWFRLHHCCRYGSGWLWLDRADGATSRVDYSEW